MIYCAVVGLLAGAIVGMALTAWLISRERAVRHARQDCAFCGGQGTTRPLREGNDIFWGCDDCGMGHKSGKNWHRLRMVRDQ